MTIVSNDDRITKRCANFWDSCPSPGCTSCDGVSFCNSEYRSKYHKSQSTRLMVCAYYRRVVLSMKLDAHIDIKMLASNWQL